MINLRVMRRGAAGLLLAFGHGWCLLHDGVASALAAPSPHEEGGNDRAAPESANPGGMLDSAIDAAEAGDTDHALEIIEEVERRAKQVKDLTTQWYALDDRGFVYMTLGDFVRMREMDEQALAFAKREPALTKMFAPTSLEHLSWSYTATKDYATAVTLLRQAIAMNVDDEPAQTTHPEVTIAKRGYLDIDKAYLITAIGVNFLAAGKPGEAEQLFREALQLFGTGMTLRGSFPGDVYESIDVLREIQDALVQQNKIEEALEIADSSRARILAARLERWTSIHDTEAAAPETIATIKELAKNEDATLVVYALMYEWKPYKTFVFDRAPISKPTSVLIWVVKPSGQIAFRRVTLDRDQVSLLDQVWLARESIGVRGRGREPTTSSTMPPSEATTKRLRVLYETLIAPIADQLPAEPSAHVVIVPQDALSLLPFATLQDGNGRYLIEEHTLTIVPSLRVLAFARRQEARIDVSARGVLVVGNPVMPRLTMKGGSAVDLPSLPGAEREAKAIGTLFSATPLIGAQATKPNVVNRLAGARIVHLATHGILDDDAEVFSAIALAPSANDTGFLTAREIVALQLSAEIAVLSACDSGSGKVTGDGLMGLSQAFMAAGTPSLLATLWSIADGPTADLMTAFYTGLRSGQDKASALRSGILQTMKKYPDPGIWGAFILMGEAAAAPSLRTANGTSAGKRAVPEVATGSRGAADTVFPVPDGAEKYSERPSPRIPGTTQIRFQSTRSIRELLAFYRAAFEAQGLKENTQLAHDQDKLGQVVYVGSPNGHPLVVLIIDLGDFSKGHRSVSVRFER